MDSLLKIVRCVLDVGLAYLIIYLIENIFSGVKYAKLVNCITKIIVLFICGYLFRVIILGS